MANFSVPGGGFQEPNSTFAHTFEHASFGMQVYVATGGYAFP